MDPLSQGDGTDADDLRSRVGGEVLRSGDDGYDDARAVWNTRFDSRPSTIVRCSEPSDVVAAVNFARDRGVALTIKSGGHDYAGNSASHGGLLVDLSLLTSVRIDADSKQARVGAGVTWGAFDHRAQSVGLAAPGGTVSSVGVAGFTLGGGEGWLARKHGLALDSLVSADMVTADGEIVRASADENPDLFWAIRGGGGNFGVVTTFEFALHEVGPQIVAGQMIYAFEHAEELLRFYRDYFSDAPDEVTCYIFFLRIPPVPPFPEQYHGQLAVDFALFHTGPAEEGLSALAPFQGLGKPILDMVEPQPYLALQQAFDSGLGKGHRWYSRAHYLDELSDEAITTFIRMIEPMPGSFTTAYFSVGGGAVGRADPAATAFPHRNSKFGLHIFPGWDDPAEDAAIMAWTREVHVAMAPHANGGVYVNLLGDDERPRVPAAYGANYSRLAEAKARWDPENLFRVNHNIEPAS